MELVYFTFIGYRLYFRHEKRKASAIKHCLLVYFIFGSSRPTERLKQTSIVETWSETGEGEWGWLLCEGGGDSCRKPEKHELGVTLTFLMPFTYQSRKKKLQRRSPQLKTQLMQLRKESPKKIRLTGIRTLTSVITNWASKPTGSWTWNWLVIYGGNKNIYFPNRVQVLVFSFSFIPQF